MAQKLSIAVKPTFSAPVVLPLAGDDGAVVEITFTAIFKRLPKTETESLQKRLEAKNLTDAALLDVVLGGWDRLDAVDGTPFAFSAENRASATEDWPGFEAAIVLSYFKHHAPAAAKN